MPRNINHEGFRREMQSIQPSDLMTRLASGAGAYMIVSSEPDETTRFYNAVRLSAQSMAIYLETQGVEIPASFMADFGLEPC